MDKRLFSLAEALKACRFSEEKIALLDRDPFVSDFLSRPSSTLSFLEKLSSEDAVIVKSIIALGQADRIFPNENASCFSERMNEMIQDLRPVEQFYRGMGGLIGYQAIMLQFLAEQSATSSQEAVYHCPVGTDLSEENDEVRTLVREGIFSLSQMGEIYPVGGAADRLRLYDPETKMALPAARLKFVGKTLLEHLITDLQAREYLHFKLFHQQVLTPIAMMTSREKDNHNQILKICQESNWFGRPSALYRFFCQPVVPTMNREGAWSLLGPGKLLMKPGGHGVIWKLAKDEGILDWFSSLGRKKLLVRQINNPIAGCDYGLLAFTGKGCSEDKLFGFSSCLRQIKAAEGVNVLIEKRGESQVGFCLTNIEYCDFKKFGIEDVPVDGNSAYSKFPSNTNILFADIDEISKKVAECPIPGMIVNLKKASFLDEKGNPQESEIARLESTMQNIADCFEEKFESLLQNPHSLRTFLTYSQRRKTISTVKKEFSSESSLLETPEGCYFDLMSNAHDLLSLHCGFQMPSLSTHDSYLKKGPSFHFLYHPALGPLYSIISRKLRKGVIKEGSEWLVEIAELEVDNLQLDGSLVIVAENVMGHCNEEGVLEYSERVGRCRLKNVTVKNLGIAKDCSSIFWKNQIERKECCEIILKGESEFVAEDVVLAGNKRWEVEAGMRMIITEKEGQLHVHQELLNERSWQWECKETNGVLELNSK